MTPRQQELLRSLPAVGELLNNDPVRGWMETAPRRVVVEALQAALAQARRAILHDDRAVGEAADEHGAVDVGAIVATAAAELQRRGRSSLRRVINATGIVLHTGLGRAPLSRPAVEAIAATAAGYCNLELDLERGGRGRRVTHVAELLCRLTGAEAATVVNNNAAATLLILKVLAEGREVVVSRGQLIEIGGSFRLPDIMAAGGAILREVGTTNRTRVADYERVIGDATAILMHVHTSNYRIVGFTEETPIGALAELAHRFGLIVVDDLGSGALFDLAQFGLPSEPDARASLAAGADLVCFSGDKLLGGPQAGVILGRREHVERIERHPLMRTYRVDKLTLLAMEATLRAYHDPAGAVEAIPSLTMLSADAEVLAPRARALSERLSAALPDESFLVCSDVSFAGGGAMPYQEIPTVVVQWRPVGRAPDEVAAALRRARVPAVARVRDDALQFDLRTIAPDDLDDLVESVCDAVDASGTGDDPASPEHDEGRHS